MTFRYSCRHSSISCSSKQVCAGVFSICTICGPAGRRNNPSLWTLINEVLLQCAIRKNFALRLLLLALEHLCVLVAGMLCFQFLALFSLLFLLLILLELELIAPF